MSIFIKLDKFHSDDREEQLKQCVHSIYKAENNKNIFLIEQEAFNHFPETRWLYWLQKDIRRCFLEFKTLKQHGLIAAAGLQTNDDFRFIRSWCEVPIVEIGPQCRWSNFYKGGEFSPMLDDINLVVLWADNGYGIKQHTIELGNSPSRHVVNEDHYFNQGLAYINVSSIGFSTQIFPKDVIFSIQGQYIQPKDWVSDLGILCSSLTRSLLQIINPGRHYQAGQVQLLPYVDENINSDMRKGVLDVCNEKYEQLSWLETSRYFKAPLLLNFSGDLEFRIKESLKRIDEQVKSIRIFQKNLDHEIFRLYGQDKSGINFIEDDNENVYGNPGLALVSDLSFLGNQGKRKGWILYSYISFLCGVAFSRWKKNVGELEYIRIGDKEDIPELPKSPPAYNEDCGPVVFSADYLCEIVKSISQKDFEIDLDDFPSLIKGFTVIEAFLSGKFFDFHFASYSKSRRYAPIYWPLQTPTGSYTLWIYCHRLNEQSLYTCVNDFVEPKIAQVEQDLNILRNKSARSGQEEKELEKLSDLSNELRDFRDELLNIAKFWKPNLNDGVQITAAPLWKLFQHKGWQKKLKDTWAKLEKGDFDWAHLACSVWPDRVLDKCHKDRSLAIAHDVEEFFWHEAEVPVKRGKKLTGETKLEWQPKALNEPALLALIKKIKEGRGL